MKIEPKNDLTAERVAVGSPAFDAFLTTISGELLKPANPDVLGLVLRTSGETLFVSEGDWVIRWSRTELSVWDNVTFQRRFNEAAS